MKTSHWDHHNVWVVGLSGGLDSTVLLHQLLQSVSTQRIHAVYVHHGLSPHADAWQKHCETLCAQWGVFFSAHRVSLTDASEQTARLARYAVFESVLPKEGALFLGHHADDQTETVLLHVLRGTGLKGLMGMPSQRPFGQGMLYRPLLACTRQILEQYARKMRLPFIEDESNHETMYTRNYLRHEMIPQLKKKWPKLTESMLRCAENFQKTADNLRDLAYMDCPSLKDATFQLPLASWCHLSHARMSNVLMHWLSSLGLSMPSSAWCSTIIETLVLSAEDRMPQVQYGSYTLRRYQRVLYVVEPISAHEGFMWENFPQTYRSQDMVFHATPCLSGIIIPKNAIVAIRFRIGGERIFYRGHRRALKKIFQAAKIPPWVRHQYPLVYVNDVCVAVLGVCVADQPLDEKDGLKYELSCKFTSSYDAKLIDACHDGSLSLDR